MSYGMTLLDQDTLYPCIMVTIAYKRSCGFPEQDVLIGYCCEATCRYNYRSWVQGGFIIGNPRSYGIALALYIGHPSLPWAQLALVITNVACQLFARSQQHKSPTSGRPLMSNSRLGFKSLALRIGCIVSKKYARQVVSQGCIHIFFGLLISSDHDIVKLSVVALLRVSFVCLHFIPFLLKQPLTSFY